MNKNNILKNLVLFLDLSLLVLVLCVFCYDIFLILSSILDKFDNIYCIDNFISYMSSNNNSTSTTNTTIIHSNDGWAQGIKSIFVYGTGALRLQLLRSGGTPLQRGFVIGSTIAADAASTALKNAINDPEYVEKPIKSWQRIFRDSETLEIPVDKDSETLTKVNEIKNSLIPEDINSFSETLLNSIITYLKPILEPITVDYSNEILANQIYGISIILFILSLLILVLLIAFMINILIFVYSDKLMNLFTNKYIKWYIVFNKKIIGIEICFIGASLIYFMYFLSYGIHFIATHPIIFN
uniref:Uncharacterized protein n=1 Tax=Cantharellus appalachiensis TaxID=409893 RepID=A0A2U3TML3_9AGAM|nr:hypothetical protein [Cantharellus appalachiensis]AWA82104.1 hypothetical protein [Cantharellus appalachiensis]